MRIEAKSGLRGRLILYVSTGAVDGWAVVERDDAPLPGRSFSVHHLYTEAGELYSQSGRYDLTRGEAERMVLQGTASAVVDWLS